MKNLIIIVMIFIEGWIMNPLGRFPVGRTLSPPAQENDGQRVRPINFRATGNNADRDSLEAITPRYARIGLIARADNDSVVLRWAPSKAGAWRIANKLGYVIDRIRIDTSGKLDTTRKKRLNATAIKPWTLDELKNKFKEREDLVGIAGQVMYGKNFTPPAIEKGTANELIDAAMELENRYGFAMLAADNDPKAAEVLGLRWVDKDVHPGETYAYRVYPATRDTTYRIDTGYCIVDVAPFVKPASPEGLVAKSGDKNIQLEWENTNVPKFSGFYIERSEDNGNSYHLINHFPIVNVTPDGAKAQNKPRFTDTLVVDYKPYRYRVYGVNAFGDHSEYSEVEAYGQDFTPPPAPYILPTQQLGANKVKIKWEMKETSPDLNGFVVARSDNSLQGFVEISPLLPTSAREFVDDSASEDYPFYLVYAKDTATNIAPSLSIMASVVDTLPPMVPTGLTGTIDTNGIVTLHWKLSTERKLKGYRVLWANDLGHEFTQRVNHVIEDTTFIDTVSLNTLTEYVYYEIASVSKRFGHSAPTVPLAIRRPDKVPPEASVFTGVHNTTTGVQLYWNASTSHDVKEQVLLRRSEDEKIWHDHAHLSRKAVTYTDNDVEQGKIYYYRLDVVDSTGLHCKPAGDVQGRAYDDGVRNKVTNLQATYDQKSNSMNVSWSYTLTKKEKYWFVVYRGYSSGQLMQYKSVPSAQLTFNDGMLIGKGTYHYAIRVLSENGGDSGVSESITVEVQ